MKEKKICFAVKGLIFYEDKFLILHKAPKEREYKIYWELPGGGMEFGEAPKDTLLREIKEETGLDVLSISLLSTWNFVFSENIQIVGVIYLCKTKQNKLTLSQEHDNFEWVRSEDFQKHELHKSFVDEMKNYDWKEILKILN